MSAATYFCLLAGAVVAGKLLERFLRKKRRQTKSRDALAATLLYFGDEPFSVRELLSGLCIFGRPGSGKTSSSGRTLGTALASLPGSGGIIFAAKPGEDRALWQGIFKSVGRELTIIEPGGDVKCNLLEYIIASGGSAREVTRFLMVVNETLRSSDAKGGESADFFEREQDRQLYHAVVALKLACGKVSAPDLQRFIAGAAQSGEQLSDERWREGFHNQTLRRAFEANKNKIEQHDLEMAIAYWLGEYPLMADRTRSGITTGTMGLLFALNSGVTRELISEETTFTPKDLFAGRWFLLDYPVSEGGDGAAAAIAGLKYVVQKAILQRKTDEHSNIIVVWADEAASVANRFDAIFINQCRSHRSTMVFLGQSLSGFYAALRGEGGKNQVDALMAGFSTKIFHALADVKTAEMAQALIGRKRTTFVGTSSPPVQNLTDELWGRTTLTTSTSQHQEWIVEQNAFFYGLRTGGAEKVCDAIVVKTGSTFADGRNYRTVAFAQE